MSIKHKVPKFLNFKKSATIFVLLILLHLIVNKFATLPAQSALEGILWYFYIMICFFTCAVYHQIGISFYQEIFTQKYKSQKSNLYFISVYSVLTTSIVFLLVFYDSYKRLSLSVSEIFFENFNWFLFLFIGILTSFVVKSFEKIDNIELIDLTYWAHILILMGTYLFFETYEQKFIMATFLNGVFAYYLFTIATIKIKKSYNS